MILRRLAEQYHKYASLNKFIIDYIAERDRLLNGLEITSQNLDAIMPRLKANLKLKLVLLKATA